MMKSKIFGFLAGGRSLRAKSQKSGTPSVYSRSRRLGVESLEQRLLLTATGTGTDIDPYGVTNWADLKWCTEQAATDIYIKLEDSFTLAANDTQITIATGKSVSIDGTEGSANAFIITGLYDPDTNPDCNVRAFEVQNNSTLSLTNVKLVSFASQGNGGIIFINSGGTANFLSTVLDGIELSGGHAKNGGAICNYGTITSDGPFEFSGNVADRFGGGYFGCGQFTATDAYFEDNLAQTGGGIYSRTNTTYNTVSGGASITFGAGEFYNNTASGNPVNGEIPDGFGNGGAIANWGTVTLGQTTAINFGQTGGNIASRHGGAVFNGNGGTMTITGEFRYNGANCDEDRRYNPTPITDSGYGYGGAISNFGTLTLNDGCTFLDNAVSNNGGAIASSGTITFNGSHSFSGNKAKDYGGAIITTGVVEFEKDVNGDVIATLTFAGNYLSNPFGEGSNQYYKGADIADGSNEKYFYDTDGSLKKNIITIRDLPDTTVTPNVITDSDCVFNYKWNGILPTPSVSELAAPVAFYPVQTIEEPGVLEPIALIPVAEAAEDAPLTLVASAAAAPNVPVAFIPVADALNIAAPDAIAPNADATDQVLLFDSLADVTAVAQENLDFVTPETTQNYDKSDEDEALLDLRFDVL